ncbi:hypothetical protein [Anabaena sphaerica]|uniref:hypothetical protein n=1 Tax=Anabaena sphaerica TaxID=212446 RepID=UPI001F5599DD|nr:hypothetical protein [Anabaena sphaerica]
MLPVVYADKFLEHNPGNRHPEKPERLTAIVKALKTAKFADKIAWRCRRRAKLSPTPVTLRNWQFL